MAAALNREAIIPKVCQRLAEGESLRTICAESGFPNRMTLHRWCEDDPEIATAIAHARNVGFDERAERAVEEAKSCEDATKARLAFDAERWYLAKLNPARYGERQQIAQTDINGNDVAPPPDPAASLAAILDAARQRRETDGSDLA